MSTASYYFSQLAQQDQLLTDHGFNHWPSDKELLSYVFDLNDKLDILMSSLNPRATKNLQGHWHLYKSEEVDSYDC